METRRRVVIFRLLPESTTKTPLSSADPVKQDPTSKNILKKATTRNSGHWIHPQPLPTPTRPSPTPPTTPCKTHQDNLQKTTPTNSSLALEIHLRMTTPEGWGNTRKLLLGTLPHPTPRDPNSSKG